MKKRTSKLLSLLLTLTMVVGMLSMGQVAYAAGEITELTAIGVVAPVVGEYPNVSGITAPTGAHYTIGDVSWRSSTDPTWTGNTPFQEGHVYRIYIEFIPEDGYEISNSAAVSINGVEYWYSKFASSNTITGAKKWMFYFNALGNAPLTITNDGSLNIPAGSCEQEIIETLDLKTSVTGGKAPYFYSITGPTWLSLNAYDCIVGTRPDTPQAATTATITVTDSDSPKNTASVTIQVGAVTENSNLIKQLTAIGVTPPAVGEMPTTAGIVAPTSANYTVESASWRRIGDDWLGNTAFEAGYRYQLFLRFVPKAGYEIANSEALSSVTLDGVNGYAWSRNSVNTITGAIGITFTFKTLGESTSDYNVTINNDGNGTASASPTSGPDGTVVTLTATPNPGYKFKEWVREAGMLSGGLDVPNATSATTTFMISGYNVVVTATFEESTSSVSPTITTSTLPNGKVGTEYNQSLAATGDTPITWAVDGGNLPTGLTLAADGKISGTPTTAGDYTFTVKATNGACSDTKSYTVTIAPADAATEYPVWVGGTQVTDANKEDILGDGKVSYTPGEGSGTLTITGTPAITGLHEGALIYANGVDLTMTGSAELNNESANYGIYLYSGSLTILNAQLTIKNVAYCGIEKNTSDGGKVTITNSEVTVEAGKDHAIYSIEDISITDSAVTCSTSTSGMGLFALGSLSLSDSTITVDAKGNWGIYAGAGIDISGGKVNSQTDTGYALYTKTKSLTIDGAVVIVKAPAGGIEKNTSDGGKVTITNSEVTVEAGKDHAIYSIEDISITDSTVTCSTSTSGMGLFALGSLSLSDSTITVDAKGNWGIYAGTGIDISGGKVDSQTDTGYAIYSKSGITISAPLTVILPEDGKVSQVTDGDVTAYTVTEADGSTIAAHAVIEPKAVTYTVSFAANGGTGTMADVTGISGEYTLPENGFTAPDGKQFKAWSVGGVEKAAGDTITVNANTTVTAIWEDIPAGHTHSYGSEWKSDADKHWHECSCGAKAEEAAHTASNWILDTPATAATDGTKHKECTECGYVMETGTIPATGGGEHTHSYSSDWKSDSINHWHECSCGVKDDVAAHSFKWVIDKEATATKKGSKHEECKFCGYQRPAVEIPATGSTTKPTDPTESNPNTGALDDVPQTGDNSNMILWIVLLLASGLGVTGTVVYSKRKKYAK